MDAGDRHLAFFGEQPGKVALELLVGRAVAAVVHVMFEVLAEFAGGLVAVGRIDLQRLEHDRFELFRDVRIQPARRLDRVVVHLVDQVVDVVDVVDHGVGQQFIHHQTQAEHVALAGGALELGLFWTHVGQLTHDDFGFVRRAHDHGFGDAEVGELDHAAIGDDDVRRGDVAVDDVEHPPRHVLGFVGVMQRPADPRHGEGADVDVADLVAVFVGANEISQVFPVGVFHHDVVDALGLAELVDLQHVLVDKVSHQFGLTDEQVDVFLVLEEFALDRLDRHDLAEAFGAELLGEVDRAHATRGDLAQDLIVGDELDFLHGLPRSVGGVDAGWNRCQRTSPRELTTTSGPAQTVTGGAALAVAVWRCPATGCQGSLR